MHTSKRSILVLLLIFVTTVVVVPVALAATTFTVDTTSDGADALPGDGLCDIGSGRCSLRAAIEEANATPGLDTIRFDLGGTPVYTIRPTTALPVIADETVIDGTSEPDYTDAPVIRLNGADVGPGSYGLHATADNVTIRGLSIVNFPGSAIYLEGANNVVEGNYLGIQPNGNTVRANDAGITIFGANARIGGLSGVTGGTACTTPCNLISGNARMGVNALGPGARIQGNLIGTDITGRLARPNTGDGIVVGDGGILVGGSDPDAGNVISGNESDGIYMWSGRTANTVVQGNLIGTDQSGTAALANGYAGIIISHDTTGPITIGGYRSSERNIISGNASFGLLLDRTTGVDILGNYIGLDVTGTAGLGNGTGIWISDSQQIDIGYNGAGYGRNYISANRDIGIYIRGSSRDIRIGQNVIGTDTTWTLRAGNGAMATVPVGIGLDGVTAVEIGHWSRSRGNIIVNNSIRLTNANGNTIQGNFIGWHPFTGPMGVLEGISLLNSSNNLIGGEIRLTPIEEEWCTGACNWIASHRVGVTVQGGNGNQIQGNSFFDNMYGISLYGSAAGPVFQDDLMDTDLGSNLGQNPPVITDVVTDGSRLIIEGSLHSMPDTVFTIDFYANDDESCLAGTGAQPQGKYWLLTGTMQTNASGDISFRLPLAPTLWNPAQTTYVTATVTDPEGNTSWFSNCEGVEMVPERLEISLILIDVQTLIDQGQLSPKYGQILINDLETASQLVAKQDDEAAVKMLYVFIEDVDALVKEQVLDPKYGNMLIDDAQTVIEMLNDPNNK